MQEFVGVLIRDFQLGPDQIVWVVSSGFRQKGTFFDSTMLISEVKDTKVNNFGYGHTFISK